MSKTKEEILNEHLAGMPNDHSLRFRTVGPYINDAMDEYAKQEAIELLKNLRERRIYTDIISQEIKWVIRNVNDNLLGYYGEATDEQLYNLYLQSKNKQV